MGNFILLSAVSSFPTLVMAVTISTAVAMRSQGRRNPLLKKRVGPRGKTGPTSVVDPHWLQCGSEIKLAVPQRRAVYGSPLSQTNANPCGSGSPGQTLPSLNVKFLHYMKNILYVGNTGRS
jgi:hypothetical protein